ncbi:hypothetical protein GCM10009868_09990 [Terrabacter aerolatus]|uniref:DUF559 domain-containing protein n=1 Tax=Terrabacter aerolatus TaxID=422442 RepID=A0A512D573_9MICO|nr:DUF559 domain-containing protein [Terrabacter aerolatus]GEO31606.1 hypothetical protein TAE01_34160 [Terrabacter aerolatus]
MRPADTPGNDKPFLRSENGEDQLSAWRFRRAHRALFRGVYVSTETPVTLRLLGEAALLLAEPRSFLSHHTAARLWGGVVPDDADVHVTYPRMRAQCFGIAAHRPKARQHVVSWMGLPMTAPAQTFLDMSHLLGLVDVVVLGDSLVRKRRFTPDELVALAEHHRGPYSRLARRAARLVRAGVDSPMETRLRLLIVLAGLPEPEVDHRVYDEHGNVLFRYDLSYLQWRLIIEYDGRQHAESEEQWHQDINRDEQLDDWELRRLVVVAKDIHRTPGRTLTRIVRAMTRQGMPVPMLTDEWRRHFPTRESGISLPA